MNDEQIERWAVQFAADLRVGGERVPLDRVISRHLGAFEDLRAKGLTWRVISTILTRAGARRASGNPIGADHLRADVSRLSRRKHPVGERRRKAVAVGAPATSPTKMQEIAASPVRSPNVESAARFRPSPPSSVGGEKELSTEELATAVAEIRNRRG